MDRLNRTLDWIADHDTRVFLIGTALLLTATILGF